MEWKKEVRRKNKNGMKKRVEGENASYCLLRCNREKPQELTKFARLFIIFSWKIIFDSFTAELFIIPSKKTYLTLSSNNLRRSLMGDAPWQANSQSSFRSLSKIVKICFLTIVSHLWKGLQGKCPAEKIMKSRGWGKMSRRDIWDSVVNVLGRWQCQDLCTDQV